MPVSAEEKGREQRQGGGEKGGKKEEGKMGKGRSQRLQNTKCVHKHLLFSQTIQ